MTLLCRLLPEGGLESWVPLVELSGTVTLHWELLSNSCLGTCYTYLT